VRTSALDVGGTLLLLLTGAWPGDAKPLSELGTPGSIVKEVGGGRWLVSVIMLSEFAVSKYVPTLELSSLLLKAVLSFVVLSISFVVSFNAGPGNGVGINIAGMAVTPPPAIGAGTKGESTGFKVLALPLVLNVSTYLERTPCDRVREEWVELLGGIGGVPGLEEIACVVTWLVSGEVDATKLEEIGGGGNGSSGGSSTPSSTHLLSFSSYLNLLVSPSFACLIINPLIR
jgi:hypothetical protein